MTVKYRRHQRRHHVSHGASSSSSSSYLACTHSDISQINSDDMMEAAIPEIADFSRVFRANASDPFIASQLLRLALLLDYGDEMGRRGLFTVRARDTRRAPCRPSRRRSVRVTLEPVSRVT